MADRVTDQARRALREALMDDARRTGDHLAYEQLAALVDDTADDVEREIAGVHLEVCAECRQDLDDLRGLNTAPPGKRVRGMSRWTGWAAAATILVASGMGLWAILRSPGQQIPGVPAGPAGAPAGARVVAVLNDGGRQISLDESGALRGFEDFRQQVAIDSVRSALANGRLSLPSVLVDLQPRAGRLMGGGASVPFALTAPIGTVVRSDRPIFRWQPLAGATSYVISVFDTNFNKTVSSPELSAAEWVVTAPLTRGQTFVWVVTARRGGEEVKSPVAPAPEARFQVLDRDRTAELERIEKAFPTFHLVRGVAYAEAGVLDAAEAELQLALRANPDSAIVKALLAQVTVALARR